MEGWLSGSEGATTVWPAKGGWAAGGWLWESTHHQGASPVSSVCPIVVSALHSNWSTSHSGRSVVKLT